MNVEDAWGVRVRVPAQNLIAGDAVIAGVVPAKAHHVVGHVAGEAQRLYGWVGWGRLGQIRGLAGTEPFHWSGERIDLLDFDQTVREVQFGAGLSPADIADLAAFLGHEPVPPSPSRLADGSLGPQAQLGQQVFAASGCGECHVGSSYTDHIRHDVGTGGRPGEALGPQFDTPTLLGLYDTPPYLHDGRAADLVALFADHNPGDRHGATGRLSTADLRDLEAFLVSLP